MGTLLSKMRAGGARRNVTSFALPARQHFLAEGCPERFFVVGIEPENVKTGIGVSEPVRAALAPAAAAARRIIEEVLAGAPELERAGPDVVLP